jgi:hypothetical protein
MVLRSSITSHPDTPAPDLVCPWYDTALIYDKSVIGGGLPIERWDYYDCPTCGSYEYRHRTHRLRSVDEKP